MTSTLQPQNSKDITYLTTKSGMKFSISFSSDPPDYSRLAKFFLLLSQNPKGGRPE